MAGTHREKRRPAANSIAVLWKAVAALLVLLGASSGAGAQATYALKGIVVTPNTVMDDGAVVVEGEKIVAVGHAVDVPKGVKVIVTNGVILPGFVDLHNHLTWNVFPRFRTYKDFGSRYDWQQLDFYHVALVTPHEELVHEGFACAIEPVRGGESHH